MPIYIYRDEETGFEKEVIHTMSETDNPSPDTLKEITYEGRVMKRVPQAVTVAALPQARGGRIDPAKAAKARELAKKRSKEHFKKHIEDKKNQANKDLIKQMKGK